MEKIPAYKRLLSYLYPVRLRKSKGGINPFLELYLYRNDLQLATPDALYSDGKRYRPLVATPKELDESLSSVHNVLVLGTGLGSAVRIMNAKDHYPEFTLVDNDKVVLQWALEHLADNKRNKIKPVCADANDFVSTDTAEYDLVIVDIFMGRVVPGFVTSNEFLQKCRARLTSPGNLILNYIIISNSEWDRTKANFDKVFLR